MQIFVDINAASDGNGTQAHPYRHIQQAADVAVAGDIVNVLPGIYRETVNPRHSGTADKPIFYSATKQNQAVVTGAQRFTGWENVSGNVWKLEIPNRDFGDYNPYTVIADHTFDHAGEVFMNNKALYEVDSLEKVMHPVKNELSRTADFSDHTWYTEQESAEKATAVYANFQGQDPNRAKVELTVRESCFFPADEGIDHLIISGFAFTKAACRWASADYNKGLVGTNSGTGWKVVNCDLSHAKCSGLALGRNSQEPMGSLAADDPDRHQIKNNTIHDCGQTGIIGISGNPSPIIEHNNLFNINVRQNLLGNDVGAINLVPSLGAEISRNCIHDCTRGLFLGGHVAHTRIARNVFYNNALPNDFTVTAANQQALLAGLGEDIHIERSAGVTVVANNLLLSDCAVKLVSQGVLLIHNLINGSTEWLSSRPVGADDPYYHRICDPAAAGQKTHSSHFFNNIFIRKSLRKEVLKLLDIAHQQPTDGLDNTVQGDGAKFYAARTAGQHDPITPNKFGNFFLDDRLDDIQLNIKDTNEGLFMESNLADLLTEDTAQAISMETAANPETEKFNTDYLGNQREGVQVTAGPFDTKREYQHCLFKLFL